MEALTDPLTAETIGLKGLVFLVGTPEPLGRFMAQSGADAAGLRDRAGEPAFLCAVLDFLLSDDALLLEFCENEALKPETVHRAATALGG